MVMGVILMVLGTYLHLMNVEASTDTINTDNNALKDIPKIDVNEAHPAIQGKSIFYAQKFS